MSEFDTVIRGGTVVNADGRTRADVGIEGGVVAELAVGAIAEFDPARRRAEALAPAQP